MAPRRHPPRESDTYEPLPAPEGMRVFHGVGPHAGYAVLVLPAAAPRRDPSALTAAERDVADLLLSGLANDAIAARRGTSVRTVDNQVQAIYRKLGVGSRLELATVLGQLVRR